MKVNFKNIPSIFGYTVETNIEIWQYILLKTVEMWWLWNWNKHVFSHFENFKNQIAKFNQKKMTA
jgi:hypothetical protein